MRLILALDAPGGVPPCRGGLCLDLAAPVTQVGVVVADGAGRATLVTPPLWAADSVVEGQATYEGIGAAVTEVRAFTVP